MKTWRERAPRGAAAEFNAVPPRATARRPALTECRALRVSLRRIVVVAVVVIVAAPFMHAFAHVVKAEPIRFVDADRHRTAGFLVTSFNGFFPRRLVAPWIFCAVASAARCSLPLGFRRKTERALQFLAQPAAIRNRVNPTDAHHRLVHIRKHRIAPKWRRHFLCSFKKFPICAVCDRTSADPETIDPDPMAWALVLLPPLTSHEKTTVRNDDDVRFVNQVHRAQLKRLGRICQADDCTRT